MIFTENDFDMFILFHSKSGNNYNNRMLLIKKKVTHLK